MRLPWPRRGAVASLTLCGASLVACGSGEKEGRAPATDTAAAADASAGRTGAPLVYVTNEDGNNISVIDSGNDSVLTEIFVGKRPRGISLSPDGSTIYAAVSGSPKAPPGTDESKLPPPDRAADGIAVIDAKSHTLKTTFKSGQDPEAFAVSKDGKKVYVSNEDAATTSVVDVASGKVVKAIPVGGEPEGVTLSPDGRFVYVTAEEDDAVYVISTDGDSVVTKIQTGKRPRSVAFTPDGRKGYVSAELASSVDVVDATKHRRTKTIQIPGKGARPMGIAVAPDGKLAYVTTGRGGTVAVIDVAADSVVGTIEVGDRPWGIAVTPDGRKAYTANGPSNDVSVIDLASRKVVKKVKVGSVPWGVAVGK
jgi:YVTN family beta-propeller protein